jgi:UDP-2,3-diacylglucosamine hydrolase
LVRWLEMVSQDAAEIHLMGDLFDFWFEYKRVVPRGFVRILGKIAELSDRGIKIVLYTGNHDMWIFDYLPKELGVELIRDPIQRTFGSKKFFLGHGDGLGPGDGGYKFIKKIFSFKFFQWCFARLHPNFGLWVANFWSGRSKESNKKNDKEPDHFLGEDKEWLVQFCKETLEKEHFDFFIFGHRHLLIDHRLSEKSRYINLGDWYTQANYAEFDGTELRLKIFEEGVSE